MKKTLGLLLVLGVTVLIATGCINKKQGGSQNQEITLSVAYQYGLMYTPAVIAQKQNLIEKTYEEATGKKVTVKWTQLSSGSDINSGIASGNIDIGFMGAPPAITGVLKGAGYRIFTNVSGQKNGLMTNDPAIRTLQDLIGSKAQIALPNIGSAQHIMLAKALHKSGVDPHSLDSNLVAMKHPDGMAALEGGNITCHLTSSPYIYMEEKNEELHELKEVSDAWAKEDSFIVGVASETLYKTNEELYTAVCDAIKEAVDYINTNPEDVAKITCELNGNSVEDETFYLKKGHYSVATKNLFDLAVFMAENKFVEEAPKSYRDLVFDNVIGD